jgi:chromosome partitioning protein
VKARSVAAHRLASFVRSLELPLVATLGEAQVYVQAAATGRTIFDLPPASVRRQLAEWAPILDFIGVRSPEVAS